LRIRAGDWSKARELVDLAFRQENPALWALRAESAHARVAGDDVSLLSADRQLSERANRAIDAATLALRAAEAATRLGQLSVAKELLDRATEMVPEHPVALTTLAEVLESTGDLRGAAEALETVASSSAVEAHQHEAWYSAALAWLDKAADPERGLKALERVAELDITHADVFDRLQALYVAVGDRAKLADLIERRLAQTESADERVALEITRGRALAEMGDRAAAKQALAAALDASPDNADALDAFAELCFAEGDWSAAEQAWIRLARHAPEPERQAEIYRKLGSLYDTELPNPQRAELSYREVLKRKPDDPDALGKLVFVHGRLGDPAKAIELATQLLERATTPEDKRDRTLGLAMAYEQIASDRRKAEATFDKARRAWPQDGTVLRALAEYHQRSGEAKALTMLLDRAANDARRALSTGRFDPSFFGILATVAELRGAADAAGIAHATLSALEGGTTAISGAGLEAGDPRLDDLLAPELLTLPLRSLLRKTGDALDSAYTADLRAMRATPLDPDGAVSKLVQQVGGALRLGAVEVYVSPALGLVCMPASSVPARVVFGQSMIDLPDDAVRFFSIVRALKILQGHAAGVSRLSPIDLWPVMAAFLSHFAPSWQAAGVDAKRMNDARQRLRPVMPQRVDDDVPVLALEVIGSIGNRASQLAIAVGQWGDRAGLLAIGDPAVAIRGIAYAGGHAEGPPPEGADRLKWIVRNPEARDLAIFSVSDNYVEARRKLGLG
jgi:cellulose synthase operon protein C